MDDIVYPCFFMGKNKVLTSDEHMIIYSYEQSVIDSR